VAILAASLANVYASLDAYLMAHLVDAQGLPLALRLHGVRRFVPPTEDPWVEVHYDFLGLGSTFKNLAGRRIEGIRPQPVAVERTGYLQINCYQRARIFSTRYTTAAVCDLVSDVFVEGSLIPVYDWSAVTESGGEPRQEAVLVCDGTKSHVADSGMQSGVIQHVIECATRYWEISTRA
jgi:hypothetical protein